VPLVAWIRVATGDFTVLFLLLSVLAGLVLIAGVRLPREQRAPLPQPAPAE
jgi:hypothetical protein